MRAALAALYWHRGQQVSGVPVCARQPGLCLASNMNECPVTLQELAESEWEFACDKINVGCSKFQSSDWLGRIRR